MPKILIEVANIYCKDTEDFTGADEVYLLHNLRVADAGITRLDDPVPASALRNITQDVSINDGQVRRLPVAGSRDYNILFDGNVRENQVVTGSVYLVDRDLGELSEDSNPPVFVLLVLLFPASVIFLLIAVFLRIIDSLFTPLPKGTGDFFKDFSLLVVAVYGLFFPVFLLLSLTLFVLKVVSKLDGDDFLGGFPLTVPQEGPEAETLGFELKGSSGINIEGGRSFSGTSGTVDYTVNIGVRRII